jgi:hypothetical protein
MAKIKANTVAYRDIGNQILLLIPSHSKEYLLQGNE